MPPSVFNKIIQKFWELPLYAVVGGAVALFDLVFFMILVDVFGYPFLLVNFLGFFLGTFINYYLCIKFIFKSGIRFNRLSEVALFIMVNFISLMFSQIAIYVFLVLIEFPTLVSKVCAICILFFWNFGIRKFFIFRDVS